MNNSNSNSNPGCNCIFYPILTLHCISHLGAVPFPKHQLVHQDTLYHDQRTKNVPKHNGQFRRLFRLQYRNVRFIGKHHQRLSGSHTGRTHARR